MKKTYITILFAFFFCIGLSAQNKENQQSVLDKLIWDDKMLNIMLDTRLDFQTDFLNDKLENSGFKGQTFRILLTGEIIPGIRYRLRHRFNKPQAPLIRDNYSSATDHIWLAFDIGKSWTITAGKQTIQLGTFEYDYAGADIYLPTMIFGDINMYETGVNAAYRFSGQTINLQVVNSGSSQFTVEDYQNKAFAANFLWEGNLFNKTLRTRWGYGIFQHDKSKFYHWITLGNQLNLGNFTTELDYYIGKRSMNYGSIVANDELGSREVQDQSLALNLKYNFGRWRPAIKGTWNQRCDKKFGSNAYESVGLQAALELYPFNNKKVKDLRFHIAYTFTNTDFQGEFKNLENSNSHLILVGTRWLFKVK